jgi:hypothetical protein
MYVTFHRPDRQCAGRPKGSILAQVTRLAAEGLTEDEIIADFKRWPAGRRK